MFNDFYGKWRGFIEELDASKASLKSLMKSMKNQSLSVDAQKKRVIDDVEKFRSEILLVAQDDNALAYDEDEIDELEESMEFSDDFKARDASVSLLNANYDINDDKDCIDSKRDTTTRMQDEHADSVHRENEDNDEGGAMTHYYGLRSRGDNRAII